MDQYLKKHYFDQICNLLNDTNDLAHAALQVDLSQLQQQNFEWFHGIVRNVHEELPKWNAALYDIQKAIASTDEGFLDEGYQIKVNCHVRFVHFPPPSTQFKLPFPNNDQIGEFREIKGTVVRTSQVKLLETKREFVCSKCHTTIIINADYSLMYRFEVPKQCEQMNCKGNLFQKSAEPLPGFCVNYQELKVQDANSEKSIPQTIVVTLDTDMVDTCQPGDCVTICGTIERRWLSFNEAQCEAVIAMRAVSLIREQNMLAIDEGSRAEQLMILKADWEEHLNKHGELGMRDIILKSISPDIHGLFPVKLAIALAICSGNELVDSRLSDGLHQRGQSHILMIGDPGLAKSKLLISAVEIAPRAVHTTGMGCSTAGLTAAAVKEDGEWQLESGALVLADGGICCIDEFNLMRESDRCSIHEAMEQQTISMAKAGIVCKLNTRCAILAAANPKNLHSMAEKEGTSTINIGIATPLLSRFDLVFILKDERIPDWDEAIADHLLAQVTSGFNDIILDRDSELWDPQTLQSHFNAISQVQPKFTPIASAILGAYYRKCRSDSERDQGRTTIRLLDSLNRLAEAHARLVFREEVTMIDAIVTIRLMESTFGFGRIVKPYDVIKEELPLGPDEDEIQCILNILEVDASQFTDDKKMVISQSSTGSSDIQQPESKSSPIPSSQEAKSSTFVSTLIRKDSALSRCSTQSPKSVTLESSQNRQSTQNELATFQDMDEDELDELLSLDHIDVPVVKEKQEIVPPPPVSEPTRVCDEPVGQNILSDDEDMTLSQAMDDMERQSTVVEPKPKLEVARPRLNLSRFAFNAPKNISKENIGPCPKRFALTRPKNALSNTVAPAPAPVTSIQPDSTNNQSLNNSVRNRIMCTPSDDEISQPEKSARKFPIRSLNHLKSLRSTQNASQSPVLEQPNIVAVKKSGTSASQNDSAYDSMYSSSSIVPSCRITGKTPAIFGPSGATQHEINEDDLSALDTLEF